MSNQDKAQIIKVLLSEYQACHMNRNHYDGVRWTIGSIFIGSSLALFGISFLIPTTNPYAVVLIVLFSLALYMVWFLYLHHVEPYVRISINRCQDIERKIQEMLGKDYLRLHTEIKNNSTKGSGKFILGILTIITILVWIFRIIMLINCC